LSFEAILIYFLKPGKVSHFNQVPKLKVLFYVAVQNASVSKAVSRKRVKINSPFTPEQNPSI